jgi:hypothetical protein
LSKKKGDWLATCAIYGDATDIQAIHKGFLGSISIPIPTFMVAFSHHKGQEDQRTDGRTDRQIDKRYKRFWKVYTFEGDLYVLVMLVVLPVP